MTQQLNKSGYKRILTILLIFLVQITLVCAAAGSLELPRVWWFAIVTLGYYALTAIIVLRRWPGIVNHRGEQKQGTRRWDTILGSVAGSLLIGMYVVTGLDIGRFHWSDVPVTWSVFALVVYILGNLLGQWAMVSNPHFETTVRIQSERNHQVIQAGPYRFVRHPGYVGFALGWLATPLALGSCSGFCCALLLVLAMLVRTALEDNMLQSELLGYSSYAKRVRFRLVPGVW